MTDYKRLAEDLDEAISEVMASVYEKNPSDTGTVECEPSGFRNGLMKVARTSAWAKGLHEAHVNSSIVESLRKSDSHRERATPAEDSDKMDSDLSAILCDTARMGGLPMSKVQALVGELHELRSATTPSPSMGDGLATPIDPSTHFTVPTRDKGAPWDAEDFVAAMFPDGMLPTGTSFGEDLARVAQAAHAQGQKGRLPEEMPDWFRVLMYSQETDGTCADLWKAIRAKLAGGGVCATLIKK